MQKSFNFFYAFLLAILGFGATLMAEDITLTTYYPAPYGAYDELSTTGNTNLATTSGNVGIGTTSTANKLHIVVGNLEGIRVSSSDVNLGIGLLKGTGDGSTITTYNGALDSWWGIAFRCKLDNTVRITFDTRNGNAYFQGNVGIGTVPSSYKLDVAGGDINITGDVYKSGALYRQPPDYVFEPGYNLMGITELKNYVFENKHLPNMPSKDDIKTDGVKIFEQNRLLLEKLEEAYLHIFQLEERISKLERR